jgi:hypothetical protein
MLLAVALQHVMHVQYALQQYYTVYHHTPYTTTTTSSVQEYVCVYAVPSTDVPWHGVRYIHR